MQSYFQSKGRNSTKTFMSNDDFSPFRTLYSLTHNNKENNSQSHRDTTFNPNISDSISNLNSSRKPQSYLNKPSATATGGKQANSSKLYQRYRKMFEAERLEKERLQLKL